MSNANAATACPCCGLPLSAFRVINLAGLRWIANGRTCAFAVQRPGYGIQSIATGKLVANGRVETPAAWRTMRDAAIVAAHEAFGNLRGEMLEVRA